MSDSLTISENERRFVAQELHDHVIQTLLQINMQVGICQRYLELGHLEETSEELAALESQITTASQQLRDLIADLRPPTSDDGTFQSMVEKQIEIHHQRGGASVQLKQTEPIEPPTKTKLTLARIIQEGLLNIRKHAHATQVTLTLAVEDNDLQLTLVDNGAGFDDAFVPNPLADKGGAGMVNMQIRAAAIGGKFDIESHPKHGTSIKVTVPL